MGEIGVIAGHEVDPTSQPRVLDFVQLARGRDLTCHRFDPPTSYRAMNMTSGWFITESRVCSSTFHHIRCKKRAPQIRTRSTRITTLVGLGEGNLDGYEKRIPDKGDGSDPAKIIVLV